MGDSSVELRKINDTFKEINKTLNRQNSILEKILRVMVLDHQESKACGCGSKAGEVPGGGEEDRSGGLEGGSGQTGLQQGTPTPRELAEARQKEQPIREYWDQ